MSPNFSTTLLLTAMLLTRSVAIAQIPVELFGGNKKATLDVMFFRYFKNKNGNNSPVLFFNRNRVGVDYKMTTTAFLPQFGFTEAISYNHAKLKGVAPVLVAQAFSSGLYTKAGVQYAAVNDHLTLFSWLVLETKKETTMDIFFLGRYTPKIAERLHLFSQLELLNTFRSDGSKNHSFTQRIRLGLKCRAFQVGLGADFSAASQNKLTSTHNMGGFLRYEY